MGLIDENLNSQLNELVGKCFNINRMLDRGMSLLSVRWKLVQTSKILHPKLAHAFLGDLFADSISGYQGSRNNETIYPATDIGNREYEKALDFVVDYYKECIEFQNMIYDVTDMAIEIGDHTTKIFLDGLTIRLAPFTEIGQNLIDLFSDYGNDTFKLQVLDGFIEKYFPD